jgi:23S rRNA (adenine2503-C2)-methyltransferase
MNKTNPLIYDLDYESLKAVLEKFGQPAFRTDQIWNGLYRSFLASAEEISTLPKALREQLLNSFDFNAVTPQRIIKSTDGRTIKTLFTLRDRKPIEAVLMYYDKRRTLCISSQSGCAMGCSFCATGHMGFHRNLSAGEIIAQVLHFARVLAVDGENITNIVVMGMGEPFLNYDSVVNAMNRLNDPAGFGLGARRFTISTIGLVPEILRFAEERFQYNLAISLHAVDDELRTKLIPINRKYPVNQVLSACKRYTDLTHRRITFEYALISGINDSINNAKLLAERIRGMLCHVNLIPLNPTDSYPGQPSSVEQAELFCESLQNANIPCTIRLRRGIEIAAGCGQLTAESWDNAHDEEIS